MSTAVPEDLVELVDTLGQDNVRRLSVRLLIDLLKLERDPARAPELARDVASLAEDLFLAGDYESALTVVKALQEHAADAKSIAKEGSRLALDGLVNTVAFVETSDLLGGMTDAEAGIFSDICATIGPAATDALRGHLEHEELTAARGRATAIIRRYGARAATRLAPLVASQQMGRTAERRRTAGRDRRGGSGAAPAAAAARPGRSSHGCRGPRALEHQRSGRRARRAHRVARRDRRAAPRRRRRPRRAA
jgi:hypothetical protein